MNCTSIMQRGVHHMVPECKKQCEGVAEVLNRLWQSERGRPGLHMPVERLPLGGEPERRELMTSRDVRRKGGKFSAG